MVERILYINGGILDRGGITTYMMNYYRHFDRDLLQVDFVAHGGEGSADREILESGGAVYHIPTKREDLVGNIRELNRIFASGKYKLVHAHMDGMNGMVMKMAQKHGIPVRISHSHSTNYLTTNRLKIAYHEHIRRQIPRYATQLWACSEAAGQWLYGKDAKFTVVPNAIDVEKFRFRLETRERLRRSLGLADKYVIGHIGWLNYPKNQEFLILLLPKVLKERPDTVLILVGEGPDRGRLETLIAERDLQKQVVLLGQRDDIPDILCTFDLFAFPSLFEGFPVTLLEAQTNGLSCVVSDQVSREVNVTENMRFAPLDADKWTQLLIGSAGRLEDAVGTLRQAGYDIRDAARELQTKYLEMLQ